MDKVFSPEIDSSLSQVGNCKYTTSSFKIGVAIFIAHFMVCFLDKKNPINLYKIEFDVLEVSKL